MESRVIVWMERVVRGGRRERRLVIGGWRGAAAMGGRGGKSVGAERGAGGGAVKDRKKKRWKEKENGSE